MKMAVDAKRKDFVIVSNVKGHAKEIHIGLGQATWKEAEANNEVQLQQRLRLMLTPQLKTMLRL